VVAEGVSHLVLIENDDDTPSSASAEPTTTVTAGGLGLAIVEAIVQAHAARMRRTGRAAEPTSGWRCPCPL
jgi:hypothetical protein